jgi:hypothetical protein
MIHLRKTYESKINNFITIDMLNRGILVNVKDEDTSKNRQSFGLGMIDEFEGFEEPVPMDEPIDVAPMIRELRNVHRILDNQNDELGNPHPRNIRMELEALLPNIGPDNEVRDNEVDGYGYEYPDHRA